MKTLNRIERAYAPVIEKLLQLAESVVTGKDASDERKNELSGFAALLASAEQHVRVKIRVSNFDNYRSASEAKQNCIKSTISQARAMVKLAVELKDSEVLEAWRSGKNVVRLVGDKQRELTISTFRSIYAEKVDRIEAAIKILVAHFSTEDSEEWQKFVVQVENARKANDFIPELLASLSH